MSLEVNGRVFPDDLFDELANMDEQHEWKPYHERYQANKHLLETATLEDEGKCRQMPDIDPPII